jgi:hypothetical protein
VIGEDNESFFIPFFVMCLVELYVLLFNIKVVSIFIPLDSGTRCVMSLSASERLVGEDNNAPCSFRLPLDPSGVCSFAAAL